jgi:outer membrane protein TolC
MPGIKPQEELWLGPVSGTNKVINQMLLGQAAMVSKVNDFISAQREQMKSAAHQLESEQKNTLLQTEEAKEGIRLQLTQQYVQLLAYHKQLVLMNEYQQVLDREYKRASLLRTEGLASEEDLRSVTKQLAKYKDDVFSVKNQYQLALVQMSFDLGIKYDPAIVLVDLPTAPISPIAEQDTNTLVQNSYAMKAVNNQLEEAQWQSDTTVTQNVYGDAYLDQQTAIAAVKRSQARIDLSKKVSAVYTEAKQAYEAYLTEERNLADLQADVAKLQARYQYGIVSLHDVQKFTFTLKQGQFALDLARMKYAVLTRKAEAMERGLIV